MSKPRGSVELPSTLPATLGSTVDIGPVIPLPKRSLQGIPLPVRTVASGAHVVRALVGGKLNPDLPLITLKHGGETYTYTLRDLKLAP